VGLGFRAGGRGSELWAGWPDGVRYTLGFLNGVSIIYCLPPCSFGLPLYPDALHLGTLILGPLAAYFAYRAMRRSSTVRGSWLAMAGNVVIMVAFLVAILAVVTGLANTAGAS